MDLDELGRIGLIKRNHYLFNNFKKICMCLSMVFFYNDPEL